MRFDCQSPVTTFSMRDAWSDEFNRSIDALMDFPVRFSLLLS